MSNNKLVSVIVPCHNMAAYLPFAIQSVLDQTYSHLEVHVIDDGSTDSTKMVVEGFISDKRVHYHYQEKRGASSARNMGLRAARGDIIALCDADDLWVANKLELQLPCLERSPNVGVVYTNYSLTDNRGQRLVTPQLKRYSGRVTDKLIVNNFVTGCTAMIRRECFDRVGLYDETLTTGEDYDLWLRISTEYDYLYLDEVTYLYRQWEGQVSNIRNEPRFHSDCIRIKRSFLEKHPGLVESDVVDEVWASSFVGRGLCTMRWERDRLGALRDIFRALQHKPTHLPAWKAVVKVLINRV